MRVLILAGGRGQRLSSISDGKNKCMITIRNKPLIEYSLDCISKLESISEIVIVVGYRAEEIINRYGNQYRGKQIKYVIQYERQGLVHAIECSKEAIKDDDFMLMLGDEIMINPKHDKMIATFRKKDVLGICGVVIVENKELVKKTYSVIQSEDNCIYRLIEKPLNPTSNIMGTGNCIFKNEILSYIQQVPINQKRGEKELPDLIQCVIDGGNIVESFVICDKYVNVNIPNEIDEAESYFSHF